MLLPASVYYLLLIIFISDKKPFSLPAVFKIIQVNNDSHIFVEKPTKDRNSHLCKFAL